MLDLLISTATGFDNGLVINCNYYFCTGGRQAELRIRMGFYPNPDLNSTFEKNKPDLDQTSEIKSGSVSDLTEKNPDPDPTL